MEDFAPETTHWVHDLSPFLIQFTDTIGLRYYGLGYLLGFVLGAWIIHHAAKLRRLQMPPGAVADLMTALIIGTLIGGRLGYFVLYEPAVFFRDPLQLVQVWTGGMASHGGFAGVAGALWWFARKHRIPFWNLTDAVVTAAPPGLFLVRIANFINGELWGKVSTVSWAVIFPASAAPGTPVNDIAPRHPSQLYEAGLEGLMLFGYMAWRYWRTTAALVTPGRITGEFLIGYALARSVAEMFREPDASLILGLSRGTFYSLFFIMVGVAIIRWSGNRRAAAGAN
ncbi:prolipoprotein diacylglyceryl transferase [Synoicihabitans lomoniglobus]|uniref:Phosphatidylglycerol--prolipoprotein diacylglyceryl transferase n=1 Tax=Synoicihabitans lomoniglobus TaxID=2909285 RepID=A0AAF0CRJ2_9BACT|nr:prolipoprotein diacylglyceryl transferase [Opitutaceae bacterium LMO-M01]WED66731.1 prolipoprotein diacylglyceryl transferase [Opitutaceae bacterium LMO-M01]